MSRNLVFIVRTGHRKRSVGVAGRQASLADNEDETTNSHSRNPSQTLSYISLSRTDHHVQTPLLQPYEPNETIHEHESSNPPILSRTVDIGIFPSFGTTNRPPHPRIILDLLTLEEKPPKQEGTPGQSETF